MWEKELEEKILFFKQYHIDKKIKYEILNLIYSYFPYSNITVKSRIKEFDSAFYKYKQKKYQTIYEIKDLIGIMIICNNKEEIYKVKECIEKNTEVIKIKDYIKEPKMGYRSVHIYIKKNNNIIYEVQIKTKAMQIAQTILHDKVYKNFNIPKIIKKIISSAIFDIIIIYENVIRYINVILKKRNSIQIFFS